MAKAPADKFEMAFYAGVLLSMLVHGAYYYRTTLMVLGSLGPHPSRLLGSIFMHIVTVLLWRRGSRWGAVAFGAFTLLGGILLLGSTLV